MMNQKEMHDLFDGQANEFEAAWAVSRWFAIGHKQGLEEGLQKIINTEITQFMEEDSKSFYVLFTSRTLDLLNTHNNIHSDRLETVKEISNLESFKAYRSALELRTAESEIEKQLQEFLCNFHIKTT